MNSAVTQFLGTGFGAVTGAGVSAWIALFNQRRIRQDAARERDHAARQSLIAHRLSARIHRSDFG
jgi:hypothetical protein